MDELSDKIDQEFAGQPDVQAELHHKFAEVYLSVSNPVGLPNFGAIAGRRKYYLARALDHARHALELRRQFYGEQHELVAKDMAYLYWCGGVAPAAKAGHLMTAINMMRATNPQNLNLPYMLEDYTSRMILPKYQEYSADYLQAVFPPTGENKYQIAERFLRESLPVYRLHYQQDNLAIFAAECKLSYSLIMQKKDSDFAEHYALCQQGAEKMKGTVGEKEFANFLKLIAEEE